MAGGRPAFTTNIGYAFLLERLPGSALVECLLLAHSGHGNRVGECLLLGAKRTFTNRCLPNSIYEYTA
jgi:hypothetical protein